ncbi:MAG: helix-turn-helix domain-containing protein [Clostridiales bacterium]|nr:helix-turn-helix domain-containing protein [Clostridiales bacterium]
MQGLKQKRKAGRWKTQEIADAAGVTIAAVYAWESGKRFPTKPKLDKLCEFFHCKVDDLL